MSHFGSDANLAFELLKIAQIECLSCKLKLFKSPVCTDTKMAHFLKERNKPSHNFTAHSSLKQGDFFKCSVFEKAVVHVANLI